jgi:hypothetical protein
VTMTDLAPHRGSHAERQHAVDELAGAVRMPEGWAIRAIVWRTWSSRSEFVVQTYRGGEIVDSRRAYDLPGALEELSRAAWSAARAGA